MGKTKTKIIDGSLPVEEVKKPSSAKASVGRPKDALAASLLEQLNQEFGEVKSKGAAKLKKPLPDAQTKKTEAPKTKIRGKKYQEVAELVEKTKKYPLSEAVELAQKVSYTKFKATLEAHINTNSKAIRGLINLPFASGKKLKILAFPSTALRTSGLKDLEDTGVIIGTDETITEIEKGPSTSLRVNSNNKINLSQIDIIVTAPEWMSKLARAAKVLGPKGLMPSPKNGNISEDLKKVVTELQAGKMEYKTEPNGQVIHLAVGKVSQNSQEISANIRSLYQVIGKSRIKKITLSPTMGPGIIVDLASI